MSQVLFKREAIPVPEPPPVTATEIPLSSLKASAKAWFRFTIVSEPFIWRSLSLCPHDTRNRSRNNRPFIEENVYVKGASLQLASSPIFERKYYKNNIYREKTKVKFIDWQRRPLL
jgi:hypothetical protein